MGQTHTPSLLDRVGHRQRGKMTSFTPEQAYIVNELWILAWGASV